MHPADVVPRLLRLAPEILHTQVVAFAVNHSLRGQAITNRLDELAGKRFCLYVDDVPVALTFEIAPTGLRRTQGTADVTLRGKLEDFVALARRREDPDTLFFQRRLVVEGETETGLHLKNLLDGWEYDVPAHVRAVLPAPAATAVLAARSAAKALLALSRLRRPSNRCNSRPAETPRAT